MALLTPLWVEAVAGDSPVQYTDLAYRQLIAGSVRIPGIAGLGDLAVTQHAGGANFTLDASAGTLFAAGLAVANEGMYLADSDAVYTTQAFSSSPSGGTTRIDSCVAVIYNKATDANVRSGALAYSWDIIPITGVASSGTPAAPTLPPAGTTWAAYAELARVSRTPGEGSLLNAAITDWRHPAVGMSDRTVGRTDMPIGSSTVDAGSNATIVRAQLRVKAGVTYEVSGYILGAQVSATGIPTVKIMAGAGELARCMSGQAHVADATISYSGSATGIYTAGGDGIIAFDVQAQSTAGALRVAASNIIVKACGG